MVASPFFVWRWVETAKPCGKICEHLIHRRRSPFPSRGRRERIGLRERQGAGEARKRSFDCAQDDKARNLR